MKKVNNLCYSIYSNSSIFYYPTNKKRLIYLNTRINKKQIIKIDCDKIKGEKIAKYKK